MPAFCVPRRRPVARPDLKENERHFFDAGTVTFAFRFMPPILVHYDKSRTKLAISGRSTHPFFL